MAKLSYTEVLGNMLKVLALIKREEGATQKELSEALGVDRKTIRRYLDDISRLGEGLKIFEEEHPEDKRCIVYKVDEKSLWSLSLPKLTEDTPIRRKVLSPCLKKYGREWTEEQNETTRRYFAFLPHTMMQHIEEKGWFVGYDPEVVMPGPFLSLVPEEAKGNRCLIFSFSTWNGPMEAPGNPVFHACYRDIEDAIEDGWKVST